MFTEHIIQIHRSIYLKTTYSQLFTMKQYVTNNKKEEHLYNYKIS